MNWQCRWSPTLGRLEDTHTKIWGTSDYKNDTDPTVFFGVYGLPDFYAVWRHKGPRHILWAGTDIIHLKNNYWLEDGGGIKIDNKGICKWLNKHCTNWCENKAEAEALMKLGIYATIQPSFLGDIDKFEVSFKPGNKVYASVSGDNFVMYGWDKIAQMAKDNPSIEFHLYGNKTLPPHWIDYASWNHERYYAPIYRDGRVPPEQMNAEIKDMQGGLRLLGFDGFSEINAKSILWGQWPISEIEYQHFLKPDQISEILKKTEPNLEGREYYRKNLNNYPWNTK
jgi:hypothetical protein